MGIQQHSNQGRRRVEGSLQNPKRTLRTTSHVLRTNQLPSHLPENHELHVQRNEDALPHQTICLYGRHTNCNEQQCHPTLSNCPQSSRQTRKGILLPKTC